MRWPRYRLSTLVLLVTISALSFGAARAASRWEWTRPRPSDAILGPVFSARDAASNSGLSWDRDIGTTALFVLAIVGAARVKRALRRRPSASSGPRASRGRAEAVPDAPRS